MTELVERTCEPAELIIFSNFQPDEILYTSKLAELMFHSILIFQISLVSLLFKWALNWFYLLKDKFSFYLISKIVQMQMAEVPRICVFMDKRNRRDYCNLFFFLRPRAASSYKQEDYNHATSIAAQSMQPSQLPFEQRQH